MVEPSGPNCAESEWGPGNRIVILLVSRVDKVKLNMFSAIRVSFTYSTTHDHLDFLRVVRLLLRHLEIVASSL